MPPRSPLPLVQESTVSQETTSRTGQQCHQTLARALHPSRSDSRGTLSEAQRTLTSPNPRRLWTRLATGGACRLQGEPILTGVPGGWRRPGGTGGLLPALLLWTRVSDARELMRTAKVGSERRDSTVVAVPSVPHVRLTASARNSLLSFGPVAAASSCRAR